MKTTVMWLKDKKLARAYDAAQHILVSIVLNEKGFIGENTVRIKIY